MRNGSDAEPPITILTVNYNTSAFIDFMLLAFEKLTYHKYQVLICDNGSSDDELLKLSAAVKNRPNVSVFYRSQSTAGSIGHGEALDFLIGKVDTPYFVIMDADAAFLVREWDRLLIGRLDDQVKAIGTQASGDKPKDFPLMYAVLFETSAFRELGCSFLPAASAGVEVLKDTGWLIREKYQAAGLRGEVLEFRNTRNWKGGPFKDLLVAEFYLDGYEQVFVSHYGRGSSLGYAKRRGFWVRLPGIRSIIAKRIGTRERDQWISIATSLVEAQCGKSTAASAI